MSNLSESIDEEKKIESSHELQKNSIDSISVRQESKNQDGDEIYLDDFDDEDLKPTNWVDKIGLRINAEIRGIQRVPESKRFDKSLLSPFAIFLSPNMSISGLATGALGPTAFGLDFRTCIICMVFFYIIGALPVGFYASFGMRFGLRQQILSRYFTGNIMGRIFAIFNVISCVCWNAINVIPCAQLLNSINHNFPPAVGLVVLVLATCILAFFGYKTVHLYERWAWLPCFIIYMIIIGRFTQTHAFNWGEMKSGKQEAGNVLSFIAVLIGTSLGWCPSAADYTINMPSNTNPYKVAIAMISGLSLPLIFTGILGAAVATSTNIEGSRFQTAYNENSIGGLVYEILCGDNHNNGYRFIIVIFALSGIANNLPGSYSLSIAIQCVWSKFAKVPRLIWCILGNLASLAFSIPAYYYFEEAMTNFLSIIGYNVSIYVGLTLAEHFIYRKGYKGYNPSDYNDKKTLPVGISGIVGFCFGICSTVLSMNQTWYTGVIARKFGEAGGDISCELNIIFAFIGYNLVRPFEKKYFGR
ncbi:unnamed protein product [Candida verbasci]|uniref:Purine-cytosine permease n=1 Tax=Candida verbasci TaxID=1227364 RepID=A0A9W4TWM9_9ASCO|nr:unnamed protein product [Candida verbasci]